MKHLLRDKPQPYASPTTDGPACTARGRYIVLHRTHNRQWVPGAPHRLSFVPLTRNQGVTRGRFAFIQHPAQHTSSLFLLTVWALNRQRSLGYTSQIMPVISSTRGIGERFPMHCTWRMHRQCTAASRPLPSSKHVWRLARST